MDWDLEVTKKYERAYKKYSKKQKHELIAVLANLNSYFKAIKNVKRISQVKAGFIHVEKKGVLALDQSGGGKTVTKLQETRLYIYPYGKTKTIYLITIGNKNTQDDDIKYCSKFVKELKKG